MSQYKDIPQPTDQRNVSQNDILTNYRYLSTPLGGPPAGVPNGILPVDHQASGDNVANPKDGFHVQTSYIKKTVPVSTLLNSVNNQSSDAIEYGFEDGALEVQPYWYNGTINSPMMPIRAFVSFTGGATILGNPFNVNNAPGSVVHNGDGTYKINFSVALPTIDYLVFGSSNSTTIPTPTPTTFIVLTKNLNNVIVVFQNSITGVVRAPQICNVMVMGIF